MRIPAFTQGVYQLIPYTGSKTRMAPLLHRSIPGHIKTVYSPFMGSAAFEIWLANKGYEVFAYDKLEHIVNLFQCFKEDKKRVHKIVREIMTRDRKKWEKYATSIALHFYELDKWRAAAMTYVVFWNSMGGLVRVYYNNKQELITNGFATKNPIKFISPNTKIQKARIPRNIHFDRSDYRDILQIKRDKNAMLYLDPPYDIDDYLYGFDTNTKQRFNHIELRDLLNGQKNWILSYGDTSNIRELYKEFQILEYVANFGVNGCDNKRLVKELVILSHDITEYWNDHGILAFNEVE